MVECLKMLRDSWRAWQEHRYYAKLEREHFGCPKKRTGIYAPAHQNHLQLRELLIEARQRLPHDSEAAAKIDKYLKSANGAG